MRIDLFFWSAFAFIVMVSGCRKDPADSDSNPYKYNSSWTEASHEKRIPDYERIFPQSKINSIEISLTPTQWNSIQSNMSLLFGIPFGAALNNFPQNIPDTDPEYVDVNVRFEDRNWKNVGFKLRGKKMLGDIWNDGIYKLPFHLNFDKFEDQTPAIKNQRLYGFKEISFNPGYKDPSLLHEKLASDIFNMGGIAAPQTAFYKVYINFGAGTKYCGVYCATELPEDNFLLDNFDENLGNIYKPTSTLNLFREEEFIKKNNKGIDDFSDVQQLIKVLNSPSRISNPALWHTDIGRVFNVEQFVKWLAISNAMVNLGGYGTSAENYYLYHHSNGKFFWIPWDNNEAMSSSPGIVGPNGGNSNYGLSLSMNEVTANWPLIRYLMDDPDYFQLYKNNLRSFNNTYFGSSDINLLIDKYYDLITDAVSGIEGEQPKYTLLTSNAAFLNERANLKNHFSNRYQMIRSYAP